MSKTSGLGHQLAIDAYDVSGDIGQLDSISSPRGSLDMTGIDKFAFERILTHKDGLIEFMAFFNPTSTRSHDVLAQLPTVDTLLTYFAGSALGSPAASMVAKQINYDPTRGEDGAFTFAVTSNANAYGIEWGHNLTGNSTTVYEASTGSENLTGFDDGQAAATDFGLQLYVHLTAFTGTSVTVTIQDSNDNGAGDAYATVTGATSGALTTPGWIRVATSRTENVKQWLRVALTGTYTVATLAVVVVRNTETVVY